MTKQFDTLVQEANEYAQQRNWQPAIDRLARAHEIDPDDTGILTGLGTCMLHWKGPEDALPFFQQVIIHAPDSAIAHNNLGLVQKLLGQIEASEDSYQMSLTLDPDNVQSWKNLAQLYLDQDERVGEGVNILQAVVQAHPDDADAWFMLGRCYQEYGDLDSARDLYQRALTLQPDHPNTHNALEELEFALDQQPAPADMTRIARPEHTKKLASLKSLKGLKLEPKTDGQELKNINFYGPPDFMIEVRLGVPARALSKSGLNVKVSLKLDLQDLASTSSSPTAFVFANPHFTPEMSAAVEQCLAAGKRVVVDLDEDYFHYPPKTAGYEVVGPGNPGVMKTLETLLEKIELLTVPSPTLAEQYQKYTKRVEVVPYTWARADILWEKPTPKRKTINLGVISTHCMSQDAHTISNSIQRILNETPEALLVIGGDMSLHGAFASIPENRKMFAPTGLVKDYPFLLANIDILLVPLEDNHYNKSKPDLPLMEAGVRRIPWLATPNPAFKEWGVGGFLIEKRSEWYSQLRTLLKDAELRKQLGEAGRAKAEERESELVAHCWQDVLKL